jgi:hypothetical protein
MAPDLRSLDRPLFLRSFFARAIADPRFYHVNSQGYIEAALCDLYSAALWTLWKLGAAVIDHCFMPRKVGPHWDPVNLDLYLDGVLVKHITSRKKAKAIVQFLDEEERQGWPEHMPDVRSYVENPNSIHDIRASLNDNLKGMKFSVYGGGDGLRWKRA